MVADYALCKATGPNRTQTLEVLGTKNLLDMLRDKLEAEGVGVTVTKSDPPTPVKIYPVKEKVKYDIAIPITKPVLTHNVLKLNTLSMENLEPITDAQLGGEFRLKLTMQFAHTETVVHDEDVAAESLPIAQELLGSITNKVLNLAKLPNVFAQVYPLVRQYVQTKCFAQKLDLDDSKVRAHLRKPMLQETIAKYLARKIAELTVEKRELEFENQGYRISETKPFTWRRNLPPIACDKTIFNYVSSFNSYETAFAVFLDNAPDVVRFASLGTTEQGESGCQFRVDYLKPSGAIGFYHPDWVAVQLVAGKEINWIIETKGRVWEGTDAKDEAITDWCGRVSAQTGELWQFRRINQPAFELNRTKDSRRCCVCRTGQAIVYLTYFIA